eukprot:gene26002-biopygen12774
MRRADDKILELVPKAATDSSSEEPGARNKKKSAI